MPMVSIFILLELLGPPLSVVVQCQASSISSRSLVQSHVERTLLAKSILKEVNCACLSLPSNFVGSCIITSGNWREVTQSHI